MRRIKIQEQEEVLEAVIYDIFLYDEADPTMMYNLKREYDNVVSQKLIQRSIDRLDIIVDMKKVINQFLKYKIRVV